MGNSFYCVAMRKALIDKKSTPNTPFEPKKRKKITRSYLENAGAYYLERFSASISQFKQVMGRKIDKSCKDHPDQNKADCISLLDEVIIKFVDLGYLNDDRYARTLLASLQQKGLSRTRILGTLRIKGINADLVQEIMPEESSDQERQAALRWAKKKRLGPFILRQRENDMQRGLSSLARAGFGYEIATWVMSLTADDAHDLLQ